MYLSLLSTQQQEFHLSPDNNVTDTTLLAALKPLHHSRSRFKEIYMNIQGGGDGFLKDKNTLFCSKWEGTENNHVPQNKGGCYKQFVPYTQWWLSCRKPL